MTEEAQGRPGAGDSAPPMPVDEVQAGTLKYPGGHVHDGANMGDTNAIAPECVSVRTDPAPQIAVFAAMLARAGRPPKTIETYSRAVRAAARAVGSDPATWTPAECDRLMASTEWAGWRDATRALCRAALKNYWKFLGCDEMLGTSNRLFWLTRSGYRGGASRREELKAKAPSPAEVQKVLAVCRDTIITSTNPHEVYRHYALFLIAAYGLRCVCTTSLRVCDVRPDQNVLHVPHSKGDKARDIYMDVPCRDVHERYMSARSSIVADLRKRASEGVHVCTTNLDVLDRADQPLFFGRGWKGGNNVGEAMPPKLLGRMVSDLTSEILDRDVNPQAFRHAKVFELLEAKGLPIQEVARYMGHSDIQTTMDYSFAGVEQQRVAFQRAAMNGNGTAPAAPPAPPTTPPDDFRAKVAVLADLQRQGILTAEAFAAAVGALAGK